MSSDETRLYAMVTSAGGDVRYFKIGVTANLTSRMQAIQTGCPTPITAVMSVILPSRFMAESAERELHDLLSEYRVSGEWFAFNMKDPVHKEAFNSGARHVLDKRVGTRWLWSFANTREVRELLERVRPQARSIARANVVAHAYRMAKGMPMW